MKRKMTYLLAGNHVWSKWFMDTRPPNYILYFAFSLVSGHCIFLYRGQERTESFSQPKTWVTISHKKQNLPTKGWKWSKYNIEIVTKPKPRLAQISAINPGYLIQGIQLAPVRVLSFLSAQTMMLFTNFQLQSEITTVEWQELDIEIRSLLAKGQTA